MLRLMPRLMLRQLAAARAAPARPIATIRFLRRAGLVPVPASWHWCTSLVAWRLRASKLAGKSRTFVMYATALVDASDWQMSSYREGRCRGARELHELRGLHAEHPKPVEDWIETTESNSRDRIAALRVDLAKPATTPLSASTLATVAIDSAAESSTRASRLIGAAGTPPRSSSGASRLALQADLAGQVVDVALDEMPARDGDVHVRPVSGGAVLHVAAERLELLRVVAR